MFTEMDSIHKNANTINGWLSRSEGALLYKLASSINGNIVEIGSFEGRSTFYMALAKMDNKKNGFIYAVDTFTGSTEHTKHGKLDTYNTFIDNMKKYDIMDYVKPIRNTSIKAANECNKSFSLIFIDGAHDYENVKNDFFAWSPKLEADGMLLFHDTIMWKGPKRFIKEYILNSNEYTIKGIKHSIMYIQKTPPSFFGRMKGFLIYGYRGLYELMYKIKKRKL